MIAVVVILTLALATLCAWQDWLLRRSIRQTDEALAMVRRARAEVRARRAMVRRLRARLPQSTESRAAERLNGWLETERERSEGR